MKRAIAIIAMCSACSSTGEQGGAPLGYPHGGTGQFTDFERDDTGLNVAQVLVPPPDNAVEDAMIAGERMFFASAAKIAPPVVIPTDVPPGDVYWPAFEARTISIGTPVPMGVGFMPGRVVLQAQEAWEGGFVTDPWAVVLPDGRVRLYYSAAGGIGVAEAPSIDGDFARLGTTPIVTGTMRRPSVVRGTDDRWWMFYDDGTGIQLTTSSDGLSFGAATNVVFAGDDLGASPEVSIGMPGAVRVEPTTGRALVHIYFESRRMDGARDIYVGGTSDGTTFTRHMTRVMVPSIFYHLPAPIAIDRRTTHLVTIRRTGPTELHLVHLSFTPRPLGQ